MTEESRKKMSLSQKKNPVRYWLNKKRDKHTKQKISESGKGLHTGKKNGMWKGGITKIDKLCRRMIEYLKWRSDCFQRDNWTCQTCNKRGVYLTVHHIKGLNLIVRENKIKNTVDARKCSELWDINNGVTLCEDCHKLTDNYKGRGIKKCVQHDTK